MQNPNSNWWYQDGQSAAFGILSDGVYGGSVPLENATNIQLTTAWGINASYEHFWNPRWRTSLYDGYADVSYNGLANAILCTAMANGAFGCGIFAVATTGCSNDWSSWWIGSRTQWNVTKDFYLGVDSPTRS
jgi:Porin subfamily